MDLARNHTSPSRSLATTSPAVAEAEPPSQGGLRTLQLSATKSGPCVVLVSLDGQCAVVLEKSAVYTNLEAGLHMAQFFITGEPGVSIRLKAEANSEILYESSHTVPACGTFDASGRLLLGSRRELATRLASRRGSSCEAPVTCQRVFSKNAC